MTKAYEYPVDADRPIKVWPPMRTGIERPCEQMTAPTAPSKAPPMKKYRRPNMSGGLKKRVSVIMYLGYHTEHGSAYCPTRVRPMASIIVYTKDNQMTGPGPMLASIWPR